MKTRKHTQILILLLLTFICVGCGNGDSGEINTFRPNENLPENIPSNNNPSNDLGPQLNTGDSSEQVVDIECGGAQNLLSYCMVEGDESSFIVSAEVIYEYSDNKCRENKSWRISEELDSIQTWDGCDAIFRLEVILSNEVLIVESVNLGEVDSSENENIRLVDASQAFLDDLQVGDNVYVESLFELTPKREGLLIMKAEESLFQVRVYFSEEDDSWRMCRFGENLYLLNDQMDVVKVIQFRCTSRPPNVGSPSRPPSVGDRTPKKHVYINNLKGIEYILIPTERPVEKITWFFKKSEEL